MAGAASTLEKYSLVPTSSWLNLVRHFAEITGKRIAAQHLQTSPSWRPRLCSPESNASPKPFVWTTANIILANIDAENLRRP